MIDPARILALAQLPAQRTADRRSAVDRLMVVGGVRNSAAARPVSWSAARCLAEAPPSEGAELVGGGSVCGRCPIRRDCFAVPVTGAPAGVRQWRERLDGGLPVTD
ncbi:hypothetical protein Sviol_54910 [Streptomyces violascens]|uniref:4Fe-4S Wbl-type domain-containing protein n=1 Tax=Streptomyces violascens TaxID=67381 RepID=A0ABQ3QV26_9ACTN|nr:hypothetical protein Sviol_54910 [Streptomyces violascens]